MHLYEEHGDGVRGAAARDVRGRDLGRPRRPARARARPLRDQAALLPRRRRRARVRVRARALPRGEVDLDALEAFLAFNSIPAPLLDLPRGPQAAARAPARLGGRREPRSSATRGRRPCRGRRAPRATRPSSPRSCARGCATPSARTSSPTCRSACCSRAASTRALLAALAAEESAEPLRTFSIGFEEASFDELGDARLVAERYGTRPSRAGAAAGRGAAPAGARRGLRRAVRRLVGAADLPRLASWRREDVKVALSGEGGDELFGGYYTYAADLLALRVGPLARLARPLVERLPVSTRAGELRLQGEAVRPRRAPAAARAPPRLEGDLLAGRARRADRPRGTSWDPVDVLRDALRRDAGRRAARAAAGRRPRRLPRRRPAREDRPRLDGVLARGARAVPRHRSSPTSRSRCRRGTRCAASRRRCCCGRRPSRCCRARSCTGRKRGFSIPAAAWLRGELEPFARDALGRDAPAAGLSSEPAAVDACSTTTSRGREDLSRQLWGLLALHALARAHVERTPPARCAPSASRRRSAPERSGST